jgi:hypothetical protein
VASSIPAPVSETLILTNGPAPKSASGRSGIASVHHEIDDDLFELRRIDPDPAVVGLDIQRDVHVVAHQGSQECDQIGNDLGRVHVHRYRHLGAREGEEPASDCPRPFGAGEDLVEVLANRVAIRQFRTSQFGVSPDRRQEVVEIVDDPAGELTDGLEPLVLHDLSVDDTLARDVADAQQRSDVCAFVRRDRAARDNPE